MGELRAGAGTQFDPACVDALVELLDAAEEVAEAGA
jgi:response regulator RpfG family c-di-GMP phosphodiesterase